MAGRAASCGYLAFNKVMRLTGISFDEVHFGGFAMKYIRRKFFMDVHPPLAKLLVTLSAWVGGFDGKFDFKDIGKWVSTMSGMSSTC